MGYVRYWHGMEGNDHENDRRCKVCASVVSWF